MRQTTNAVLMVEPSAFGHNPDSARTNAFMREVGDRDPREIQAAALREFESLAERLEGEGVEVLVYRDEADSPSPDAIFPNNWVTFHDDGRAILYPMEPPNRRRERRGEILDWLSGEKSFRLREVIDLSPHEAEGRFLEGTGSMVLDHLAAHDSKPFAGIRRALWISRGFLSCPGRERDSPVSHQRRARAWSRRGGSLRGCGP
jgi:hypothetical protein